MPRRKASRTEEMASCSETGPKTLPSGEAPKPTQLSLRPVFPRGRSSRFGCGYAIWLIWKKFWRLLCEMRKCSSEDSEMGEREGEARKAGEMVQILSRSWVLPSPSHSYWILYEGKYKYIFRIFFFLICFDEGKN